MTPREPSTARELPVRSADRAKRLGLLAVLALAGLVPSSASAQRLDAIFARANDAYFASDFDTAATLYEQLVEAGVEDPDVTYDLALAHVRAGRLGEGIRWLERTLLLRPGDEDAERDLAAVREELGRRQAERHGEAVVETRPPFVESLVRPLTESTLAWLVILFDVAFFSLLIARTRARGETSRLALGVAAPILGVLLAAAAFGLAVKVGALSDGEPAIVVTHETTLHEGPDERAGSRGTALEGERVRLVAAEQAWVEVRLGDGREGWAPRDAVAPIAR